MNKIEEIAGEICKKLFPIEEKLYFGNPESSIAICTLSSSNLLKDIADSNMMKKINIVGRLLSENKGIDLLVRYVISNEKIKKIILCGKEVSGHRAGNSLICLYQNGIDSDGRIIGATGPNPFVTITDQELVRFKNQVRLIDKIGETDLSKLQDKISQY